MGGRTRSRSPVRSVTPTVQFDVRRGGVFESKFDPCVRRVACDSTYHVVMAAFGTY